jgi:hypothetical protein
MDDTHELIDVIAFDFPLLTDAEQLAARLDSRWECHAFQERTVAVVGVHLPPSLDAEFAPLLREVEAWLAEGPVQDCECWIDGRSYNLGVQEARVVELDRAELVT